MPHVASLASRKSACSHHEPLKAEKPKVIVRKRISSKLQAILNPKTPVRKRYFTAGVKIDESNEKDLQKEPSPFRYPEDMEQFAHKVMTKAWRNDIRVKELELKCYQRPSYKDRQKRDLLNRLYVKEPTVESMKTMLDIDPNYFDIIEGRPIPDKLKIRDYIETVRDTLRTKIITGYREDDIMLIEENLLLEQKIIDTINENYQRYVNTFEEFLYMDHTSAMKLLKESELASTAAYEKYEEYKAVAKKYAALRSSLFNLEEKWRHYKTYQKFLYTVSPMSWRAQRTVSRRESIYMIEDEDDDKDIFGRYRLSIAQRGVSLSDILCEFKEELAEDKPAELYFTEPEQLMDVFRFMEMQNLNSLLHSEELALPLDHVKEGMRTAVDMFDVEIKNMQEIIDKLEGGISWEEQRVVYLEELALKLINDEFKALIMADDVLNLHVFVEDVYETRIGPNDANLTVLDMMKGIEEKYRYELLSLDKVPSEQVAELEGIYYAEQTLVMRLAEKAARQYAELERITRSVNKAFAPPAEKEGRVLKNRSPPLKAPKRVEQPPRSLTQQEEDYLEYFTDYCKFTDSTLKYGIDTSPVDETSGDKKEDVEDVEEEEKEEESPPVDTDEDTDN